ncbi:unnamed protein product [Prunus armeniaca]
MGVPWMTLGWVTSHTQAMCISFNVELPDQRAMCLFDGCVQQETEVSAQRRKDVELREKLKKCNGHVDEDVTIINGEECHKSHISECYHDSIGTSMRLQGSLSVEGRGLKS